MTYTHTAGVRNRFVDFSNGILKMNKPAGLITRLVNGKPHVSPKSDLKGLKIVDVVGWAPTPDTLSLVTNKCTKKRFEGYTMVNPTASGNANDAAMKMVLDGTADAMWIYSDQASLY